MSVDGAIQGDNPITQQESPSDFTEPTGEAVEVEPAAEPEQPEALGEPDPEQGEATREAINSPEFFIGNIASAIVPMTPEEFHQLRTSIDDDGQEVAISVRKMDDNRWEIIDGAHRYRACVDLGKDVKFVEVFGSDEEMRALSDRLNDKRRHLTQARLAKWVVDRTIANPEGRPRKNAAASAEINREQLAEKLGIGVTNIIPRNELAKLKGVSERSVQMAAQIKKESPEVFEKIDSEGLSLEEALKLAQEKKRNVTQYAKQSDSHSSNSKNGKPEPSEDEKSEKAVDKMRLAIKDVFLCFPKGKDKDEFVKKVQELCSILGIKLTPLDLSEPHHY